MRWRTGRRSQNVEDRRGMASARGGGMRFPVGVRLPGGGGRSGAGVGAGIGGIGLIVLVLAALFLGVDPRILLQDEPGVGGAPTAYQTAPQAPRSPMCARRRSR